MRPQQTTFADTGFEKHYKPTRREQFLNEMEQVVPWKELCAPIEPFYPKNDGAGRPTVGLERMPRIYFPRQWFNLSDPAVEESLYVLLPIALMAPPMIALMAPQNRLNQGLKRGHL